MEKKEPLNFAGNKTENIETFVLHDCVRFVSSDSDGRKVIDVKKVDAVAFANYILQETEKYPQ